MTGDSDIEILWGRGSVRRVVRDFVEIPNLSNT
jgi:hypothetical protein